MQKGILFFILLFLLSTLGQIASDIYLPALPHISQNLQSSTHAIQLSIALFFYGFAGSHLIYGPLSDRFGRKKPLIFGTIICLVGTLVCQFAQDIVIFNSGRFLQGLGAGASATIYRSILRDVYQGHALSKTSSYLGIGRILLLACAPLIGAYLLHFLSWRACFFFVVVYGVITLFGLTIFKETNTHQDLPSNKLNFLIKNISTLIVHPIFIGCSIIMFLTFAGILAWVTTLPIILQKNLGLSPIAFGWLAALVGLFFAVGGVINGIYVNRAGLEKMLKIGIVIMLSAGGLMLIFAGSGIINVFVIITPIILFILGASIVIPNAYAAAFHPFPQIAGTASAVFGFLQLIGGAISSMIMSYTKHYNQFPLSIALIVISLLALIIAMNMEKIQMDSYELVI